MGCAKILNMINKISVGYLQDSYYRSLQMQDPLDDVLSLEDQFYKEGHELGLADGTRAGRAEGRQFGMLKAFEKFEQLGILHGRADVLQKELSRKPFDETEGSAQLRVSSSVERARRHVDKLLELTDITNMQPENTEEAVADVDERLKEAISKATLITRITGKDITLESSRPNSNRRGDELEDFHGNTRFNTEIT